MKLTEESMNKNYKVSGKVKTEYIREDITEFEPSDIL